MKVSISDLLGVKKKRRFFSLTFDSFSDEVIIVKTLIFSFMILFNVVIHASAPPVVLEDGKDFYLIGLNLDILEDPTKKLTINDITGPKWSKQFKRSQSSSPNLGTADSAFWARFKVKNNSSLKTWIFTNNFETQDKIEFFKKTENGWSQIITGDSLPFSTRPIKSTPFNFKITPLSESVYFLKVEGLSKQLPLTITSQDSFFEMRNLMNLIHGLFFGTSLILILYNLLHAFWSKNTNYVFYIGHTLFSTLVVAVGVGTGQQYLWPNTPYFNNSGLVFFFINSLLFLSLFLSKLLQLKKESFKLYVIIFSWQILWAFLIIFNFFISFYKVGLIALTLQVIFYPTLIIVIASRLIKEKTYPTSIKLVALGLASTVIGSFILFSTSRGLLPSTIITRNGLLIGLMFEYFFLSLSISYRQKEVLELEIKKRTKQLIISNEALTKGQEDKSFFFAKLSHELRTPLNAILGFSDILMGMNKNNKVPQEKIYLEYAFALSCTFFLIEPQNNVMSKLCKSPPIVNDFILSINDPLVSIIKFFEYLD